MFTMADLKRIAIQIERNGEQVYRKASKEAPDPDVSSLLARMADDEQRHANWFEQLDTGQAAPSDHPEIEAMGAALLDEMMADRTFSLAHDPLRDADGAIAVLKQSLAFEEDTIAFYTALGAFIDNAQTLMQLERIIEEEQRHVQYIEQMMPLVSDHV